MKVEDMKRQERAEMMMVRVRHMCGVSLNGTSKICRNYFVEKVRQRLQLEIDSMAAV